MPKQVGTLGIPTKSGAPASPFVGQAYYDLADNKLKVYNGTAFVEPGGSPAALSFTTLTLSSPWATSGTDTPQRAKSAEGLVCLRGTLTNSATWSWQSTNATLATLPSGWWPVKALYIPVWMTDPGGGETIAVVRVNTDGAIMLWDSASAPNGPGFTGNAGGVVRFHGLSFPTT